MRPLDRTDRLILDILQRDGRIAISELATRVNLSTTPCSERVKRLERDGIITGYYARINPALVDKNLLVFLEIKLSAKSGDVFDRVAHDHRFAVDEDFAAVGLVDAVDDLAQRRLAGAVFTA